MNDGDTERYGVEIVHWDEPEVVSIVEADDLDALVGAMALTNGPE